MGMICSQTVGTNFISYREKDRLLNFCIYLIGFIEDSYNALYFLSTFQGTPCRLIADQCAVSTSGVIHTFIFFCTSAGGVGVSWPPTM